MNGPSVTWRRPPANRTVVAVCGPSSPSHAISTPASLVASSNACHAAIERAISSGEDSPNAASSPYNVSRTFMPHLREATAAITGVADHAGDERRAPERQRQRANFVRRRHARIASCQRWVSVICSSEATRPSRIESTWANAASSGRPVARAVPT